jgi:hypothetical protein
MRRLILIAMAIAPGAYAQAPDLPTAQIEGVVVDGATDVPLPEASVVLLGTDIRATTDDAGRFLLDRVPDGTHVLLTGRPGYMPARPDGMRLPGNTGFPVEIHRGERVRVRLRSYRAAAVSGRILDDRGRPWQGALVVPFRLAYADDGTEIVRSFTGARSNDLGEFRITGLDAGRYYFRISVDPLRFTAGAGSAIGTFYYPGTADPGAVEDVHIESGTLTTLNPVSIQAVSGAQLRVRTLESGTFDPRARVAIDLRHRGSGRAHRAEGQIAEGVSLGPLAPGTWDLDLMTSAGRRSQAIVRIDLLDLDIDVVVPMEARVTGRVFLAAGDGSPRAAEPVAGVSVNLVAGTSYRGAASVRRTLTDLDGRFEFAVVAGGRHRVDIDPRPGTYVRAIMDGGTDVLREGVTIDGSDISLAVLLEGEAGALEGVVVGKDGREVSAAIVALIPEDPTASHLVRDTRTTRAGRFAFESLTPGPHRLYAWRELDGAAYRNATFMTRHAPSGQPVTVAGGTRLSTRLVVLDP